MNRRLFLSRLAVAGTLGTAHAGPTVTPHPRRVPPQGLRQPGRDGFGDWMSRQLDLELLPGEAAQVQGLLAALRFAPTIDPGIEPAIRFEPF